MTQVNVAKLEAKISEIKAQLIERRAENKTAWYVQRAASLANLEALLEDIVAMPDVELVR